MIYFPSFLSQLKDDESPLTKDSSSTLGYLFYSTIYTPVKPHFTTCLTNAEQKTALVLKSSHMERRSNYCSLCYQGRSLIRENISLIPNCSVYT